MQIQGISIAIQSAASALMKTNVIVLISTTVLLLFFCQPPPHLPRRAKAGTAVDSADMTPPRSLSFCSSCCHKEKILALLHLPNITQWFMPTLLAAPGVQGYCSGERYFVQLQLNMDPIDRSAKVNS
ncbi:hypothetical protein EJ08DRAFT_529649 [Tothia fuscella]|uniref:Uncharacterized protein n=1 Tax=Tothia fuscella TaxID=1048955 RepID=A0A9P4NGV1_9PEZI|nr:hypothetical protein EJ08DRAFT_529649 [Tothia fuscella]